MNILFLSICGMSLVFFALFFVACHRDASRRKPRGSSVFKISPEIHGLDPHPGRHHLIHLEEQMADFLTHHRSASVADRSRVVPLGR